MTTEHTKFIWWLRSRRAIGGKNRFIVKVTRKTPKLKASQVAVPLEISIPNKLLEPLPTITVQISGEELIRPEVKVSEG